jgi:hypothetical protein
MFSGMWTIANQRSGYPLGQAARMVYDLPPGAVTDVTPVGSPFDVSGWIVTSGGATIETPWQLAAPLGTPAPFYSALYNGTSTRWYVLTFGTDSSLSTRYGWDDVTGVGTPNGMEFVNAVAGKH